MVRCRSGCRIGRAAVAFHRTAAALDRAGIATTAGDAYRRIVERLTISVTKQGRASVLALDGVVMACTALRLETALTLALHEPAPDVVVDVSGVTVVDGTAVTVLTAAAEVARDAGGYLCLAAPGTAICRVLRESGALAAIDTYHSMAGALAGNILDLLAAPTQAINGAEPYVVRQPHG